MARAWVDWHEKRGWPSDRIENELLQESDKGQGLRPSQEPLLALILLVRWSRVVRILRTELGVFKVGK